MPKLSPSAERLSKSAIAKLSITGARYRVRDLGCEGLDLVVEANGRKSWIFRYRDHAGVQREKSIGGYPALLPDQAREAGLAMLLSIAKDGFEQLVAARTAKAQAERRE